MKAVSKTIIACSIAAASMFGAATASAAPFNEFTIAPEGKGTFKADKITGNYTEVVTFNADNTFDVSLMWEGGQFVSGAGNSAVKGTGLFNDYGIYALYTARGTVTTNGSVTTFTFLPDSGTLSMYYDAGFNTTSTVPGNGATPFTLANTDDDVLMAFGTPLTGSGSLDASRPSCGDENGIDCGSFGSSTSFTLTDFGANFFIEPDPFYTLSFQSGQLNSFELAGTQVINGSLDVVFSGRPDGEVPEPASVGLLGLGMLGLYAARRRNKKAA